MLRGVQAASAADLPSVIPTYRNTAEGLRTGSGRSHLGATEADDIAAVLEELAAAGARSFVLFGWSMGAQMTLKLAASSEWASRVDALVLDSPVLNWASVLEENLAHSRLPRALARAATPWFRRPRTLGLDLPLDLGAMDWVARAGEVTQPVLIHHGSADWSVPLRDSAAFAEAAGHAQLRATPGGHTTSWNVDPAGWRGRTVEFLTP
jgi:pimeloyl-ACP methyl ester carboxylesterase